MTEPAIRWLLDPPGRRGQQVAALARRVAAIAPDDPDTWIRLGRTLRDATSHEDAIAVLTAGAARMPDAVAPRLALARAYLALDRFEAAQEQVDAALAIASENAAAQLLRFALLVKRRQWEAAALGIDAIARIDPLLPQIFEVHAQICRGAADQRDLLARCEAALARRPGHANAAYYRALALARLGRDDEARAAMSVTRGVEISVLPVPAGFETAAAFRAALREEILRDPTLTRDPRAKATREGLQTRTLRRPDAPAVEAALAEIRRAVADYAARAMREPGFGAACPRTARLVAWAVVLGAQGQQSPHWHPSGWLSGVFYVDAPRARGSERWPGPLVLGTLDGSGENIEPPWGTRRIEPTPGRIIMFPSYLRHATEPTGIEGERISLAFDVIAAEGP